MRERQQVERSRYRGPRPVVEYARPPGDFDSAYVTGAKGRP